MLEECLGAGVGCEERGRESTAERSHGEDKTALAGDHAWSDELRDAQSSHAVDRDDVPHLLVGGFDKRNGDRVAQANIVNEDADIETIDQFLETSVVGVLVLSKVHCERLGRHFSAIFRRELGCKSRELGFGPGDEDEVVAFCGEGEGELFADAIGCAGYERPGAAGTEFSELKTMSNGCSRYTIAR